MRTKIYLSLALLAALIIGVIIGITGKNNTVTIKRVPGPTITKTVIKTKTVKVPGPTVTKTAHPKAAVASATMPGDGTFVVGNGNGQWAPGTWSTSGPESGSSECYYALLSSMNGSEGSIINNDLEAGPITVTIGPGVAGITVSGCNTWTK
jgi:hypothetical protein